MTEHLGSCLCGTVRFKVEGAFDSFYLCHCQHCKKDTGSAHAANLFSQSAKLSWQSGADAVTSFTLPGTLVTAGVFVNSVVRPCPILRRLRFLSYQQGLWT